MVGFCGISIICGVNSKILSPSTFSVPPSCNVTIRRSKMNGEFRQMAYPLNSKQEHGLLRTNLIIQPFALRQWLSKQGPETGSIGITANLLAIQVLRPADQKLWGWGPGHCRWFWCAKFEKHCASAVILVLCTFTNWWSRNLLSIDYVLGMSLLLPLGRRSRHLRTSQGHLDLWGEGLRR